MTTAIGGPAWNSADGERCNLLNCGRPVGPFYDFSFPPMVSNTEVNTLVLITLSTFQISSFG